MAKRNNERYTKFTLSDLFFMILDGGAFLSCRIWKKLLGFFFWSRNENKKLFLVLVWFLFQLVFVSFIRLLVCSVFVVNVFIVCRLIQSKSKSKRVNKNVWLATILCKYISPKCVWFVHLNATKIKSLIWPFCWLF